MQLTAESSSLIQNAVISTNPNDDTINQLVGSQLGMEKSWSLGAAQEQERTEQAQLQTKRCTDAELLKEQIKDEEQPA
ncbi:hypothetical protein F511_24315 [Dorcoceras hygrometricum]|uniref:Uncharacterized protein n=1 Tax=Dorcoceras hygrometricum TaxID=472368 RepID=A0A2Z7B1P9_9LAMI|nr:hypothetical protein F511_24315 [Dorcoceras hygrometricum]